uniref:Uncharacterized protein n=1 Tax=Arundo donax TaxID=35708 RepID=A0A0A9ENE2_ARUDO
MGRRCRGGRHGAPATAAATWCRTRWTTGAARRTSRAPAGGWRRRWPSASSCASGCPPWASP